MIFFVLFHIDPPGCSLQKGYAESSRYKYMPEKTNSAEECVKQVKRLQVKSNGMSWHRTDHDCFAEFGATGMPDVYEGEGLFCLFSGRYFGVSLKKRNIIDTYIISVTKFAFTIYSSLIEILIDYCHDLDHVETNSKGVGCNFYDGRTSICGNYNDDDFNATQLCCSCGGGGGINIFSEFN